MGEGRYSEPAAAPAVDVTKVGDPTGKLRWFRKNNALVLQQEMVYTGGIAKWEDVAIVEAE